MVVCIRAAGTWRNATTVCVRSGGAWRQTATGCIRSGGTWRNFGFGPTLGGAYCGGFFVCQTATVRWVIAPCPTTVARTWYARADAATVAQATTGTTGWFIPDDGVLNSPGNGLSDLVGCRQYWNGYTFYPLGYWSNNTTPNAAFAWRIIVSSSINPSPGPTSNGECRNTVTGVRAFKTIPL